jgi:hypothetical protein
MIKLAAQDRIEVGTLTSNLYQGFPQDIERRSRRLYSVLTRQYDRIVQLPTVYRNEFHRSSLAIVSAPEREWL